MWLDEVARGDRYYVIKKVLFQMKGKFHKIVVRLAVMYVIRSVRQLIKKKELKSKVAEMRMLKWLCGVIKLDRIRNKYLTGNLSIPNIARKMGENRLGWFGHVEGRNYENIVKKICKCIGKSGKR